MTRGMLVRLVTLGALACSVWVVGSSVVSNSAEAQFGRGRPRFGGAALRTGFMPDPHLMSGTMGGPVQASQFNPSCRGSVTPEPSHVVQTPTGFRNIRFVVNGQADSTLMVQLPNGQVMCDDDGGEGMNPLVETSSPPGEIRIWVGAYSSGGQGSPYTIGVTELSHITANNLTSPGPGPMPMPIPPQPPPVSGINPNAPPGYGMLLLRSGFMPDPHVIAGHAGGPVSARNVDPSCVGYITPQPSHVVQAQTYFNNLRIAVNSGQLDTTLVVMLPNGQMVCNDDSSGSFNPLVSFSTPPGTIRIWVGAYSNSGSGPYNIGFSELAHVTAANIPGPGGMVVANPGPIPPQPIPPQPIPPQPMPPQPTGTTVDMQVSIPVTLFGPGLDGNTTALWHPAGGAPTPVTLSGRAVVCGGQTLEQLPPNMTDPVVTVMQLRSGDLLVRAEQAPVGRGDPGAALLLLVTNNGRPAIQDRWAGRFGERGPRWAR